MTINVRKTYLFIAVMSCGTAAFAQDTGAKTSGSWANHSIWTGGTVPGSNNNVFIGSTYPGGSASTATVTLSAGELASNVYLGYDDGNTGVLNLQNNSLTISSTLYIGSSGGSGSLLEGAGGSFTAQNAYIYSGNTLNFGGNDAVSSLWLQNNSVATTTAQGNVTGSIEVDSGSTLNLGADLNLSGSLNVEDQNSTLNMNGHAVNAYSVDLGYSDGNGVNLENRGAITAGTLYVGNMAFDLNATDTVTNFVLTNTTSTLNSSVSSLSLQNNSVATTTAQGNVTGTIEVYSGSTLNLGADLNLSGSLNVEDQNSTLNMNGHAVNAYSVDLGYSDGNGVNLENRGAITAGTLYVGNMAFDLNATDTVTNFVLTNTTSTLNSSVSSLWLQNNSVATTTVQGNVTGNGNIDVDSGSTLNLGADLNLSGSLNVEDQNSTLNMNGHAVNAYSVDLGYSDGNGVNLENRGAITAGTLYVGNMAFDLNATDTVTNFVLTNTTSTLNSSVSSLWLQNNSVATTTVQGNVTGNGNIDVDSGSTLNLGADLNLSGSLNVEDQNSTLNMNGHAVNAYSVDLGYSDGNGVNLENRGAITAGTLYVGNMAFDLNATDTVTNFVLTNATSTLNSSVSSLSLQNNSVATTTAQGNVTGNIDVDSGSTLNLGTSLSLGGYLSVQDGSTVNAGHFGITADTINVGWGGSSSANLLNTGLVETNNLFVGNGSSLTLHGGDVVNQSISLAQNSVLTVVQTDGIGLTFNGADASLLSIDPSQMDLIFGLNSDSNWDFRWLDPDGGGNWIGTLATMIGDGQIAISSPDGYSLVDQGGYTYIMGGTSAVPEPSSLLLLGIGAAGVVVVTVWSRGRSQKRQHPRTRRSSRANS